AGYVLHRRQQLFVVSLADGRVTRLTHGDGDDRMPAWAPDGRRIAWTRTRTGVADYLVSDVWVADADGGSARPLTRGAGGAPSPSWSAAGMPPACYGTDEQGPGFGAPLYRVWTAPASGGAPRRLTAAYDRGAFLLPPPGLNPGPLWSPDGAT